ncbi:MAG: hypothetical protein ACREAZ_02310 [Nitrososphaera sp.]
MVISAIILFLLVALVYDEVRYQIDPRKGIGPAIARPTLEDRLAYFWPPLVTLPLCAAGGTLILKSRRKLGVFPSLAGLWILLIFLLNAMIPSFVYVRANYVNVAILITIVLSPMLISSGMLVFGWKKVDWKV